MQGDRAAISYQYGPDGKAVQGREQSRVTTSAVDVAGTGSVRERFKNLMSNTRAALDLETQPKEQEGLGPVLKAAPEPSPTEPLRAQDKYSAAQSEHENYDEPEMDH